ncbi:MAG: hypothetical protein JWN38_887 [Candidatus Saccharibacteria bacterium]|nr:hypothetical protein [Candidatus Saccharibacteria bacterium]
MGIFERAAKEADISIAKMKAKNAAKAQQSADQQ